jgi:phosphonate transport system substrate-binding protein
MVKSKRHIAFIALLLLMWFGLAPVRAQPAAPIRLAVHPYASTLALINTFRPLQQYLETSLQRPVEFYTAASFDAFVSSLLAGEYDIVISPPHFALLAMEKDYVGLLHFQARLEPLLAVRKDSALHQPADLRGKRIAMADRSAFIRLVITHWLAENGLVAGRDYLVLERPTHAGSLMAAVMGDADAGLTTATALKQMAPDLQAQARPISAGLRFPNLFLIAQRRLGEGDIEKVRKLLLDIDQLPAGREFFAKTGYGGVEPISGDDLRLLRPYVDAYRRMQRSGGN